MVQVTGRHAVRSGYAGVDLHLRRPVSDKTRIETEEKAKNSNKESSECLKSVDLISGVSMKNPWDIYI